MDLRPGLALASLLFFLFSVIGPADARRRRRRHRHHRHHARRSPPVAPAPRKPPVDPKRAEASRLAAEGMQKLNAGFQKAQSETPAERSTATRLYREALTLFQKAHGLFPSPKLLYNMALAYRELGDNVHALARFERFVSQFHDRRHQAWQLATQWIKLLRSRIATVRIQVNVPGARVTVGSRFAGVSPKLKPIRLEPTAGLVTVLVSKPGYKQAALSLAIKGGQTVSQRIVLITEAEDLRRKRAYQERVEAERRLTARLAQERAERRQRARQRQRTLRIAGWATFGAGLAVTLAGGAVGVVALRDQHHVESAPDGVSYLDYRRAYERAEDLGRVAWAGIGTGLAVTLAGGLIVWYSYRSTERAAKKQPATRVSLFPVVGPGQAGMTFRLQF